MKNENSFDFKVIITLAGACLSFIVGAGTVSGQEIMQFLTSFGYWGIGGCVIALILYVWYTTVLLDIGRTLKVESPRQAYQYFLGDKLGIVMDYFTFAMVFLIFVVMLSGAGSTLTQYLGISELAGRLIVTAVVLATVILGLDKFVKILGCIGPVIIVFGIIIGVVSFAQNIEGFKNAAEIMSTIEVAHPSGVNYWWLSGILYVTFTVVIAVPFYTKLGSGVKSRKNVIAGGILAGVAFMAVAGVFYLAMLSSIDKVYDKPIPTLTLAQNISPLFALMFTIMILLAIYSTAVPMCWTVCDKIGGENRKRYIITAAVTCIIGFFGALFPFGTIIGVVYPYLGAIGIVLCLGMFFRFYIKRGDIAKYSTAAQEKQEKEVQE